MSNAEIIATDPGWIILVKGLLVFATCVLLTLLAIWAERRIVARMQERPGPNRVGPLGLLQSLSDGVKLALKEDLIPAAADKIVFVLAPIISATTCFMSFAVIPITGEVSLFGQKTAMQLTDLPVGVLYVLAIASVGVYGIVLAGWSSGSTYPLLGGLRSSAQVISYEVAMGLSLVAVFTWFFFWLNCVDTIAMKSPIVVLVSNTQMSMQSPFLFTAPALRTFVCFCISSSFSILILSNFITIFWICPI